MKKVPKITQAGHLSPPLLSPVEQVAAISGLGEAGPSELRSNPVRIGNVTVDVPVMLSVEEAHSAYRLSKQFLYRLAKSGSIRALRTGNKFLLSAESLSDYLRNGTLLDEKPATPAGGIRPLG